MLRKKRGQILTVSIVPYGGSIDQLNPKIESLEIGPTTESSVLVKATMNFTNPTPYSAIVPMADLVLLYNGTAVGHVVARDVSLIPGLNTGIHVDLVWNPLAFSGANGVDVGRKMVSRYISGEFIDPVRMFSDLNNVFQVSIQQ